MSVIQEALHRVQSEAKASEVCPETPQIKKMPEATLGPKPIAKKNKKKIALDKTALTILSLVVITAFSLFFLIQIFALIKKNQEKTRSSAVQDVTYRPIIKTGEKVFSAKRVKSLDTPASNLKDITGHPGLTLNGIMYIEEGPKAIINNSIVETGDLVSGAKVIKINPKNVVLEHNEVEITLNLK